MLFFTLRNTPDFRISAKL